MMSHGKRSEGNATRLYRTALRDLPQDHDEANDAADGWPTPPE